MAEVDTDDATLVADTLSTSGPPTEAASHEILANRYEILALIGAGGMGAVYRALDRELGENVALKVLRGELVDVPGMLDRFRQEVKLARKVTSPNVARTFDIGEHDGMRFITMELVIGESLSDLMVRHGALPAGRAIAIAREVAAGLAAAHMAGVVHQDLKPENVLLATDGPVKITDFGIARAQTADANRTRETVGTPAYMAPEQVTGEPDVDARADVYAFGAMLYEMVTGEMAWSGDTAMAVARARLLHPPPDPRAIRPDLPPAVAELVLACLVRDRARRPANAAEIVSLLAAIDLIPSGRSLAAPPMPRRVEHKTVAVLPLQNQGPPDDDYLARGVGEELVDELAMLGSIRVRVVGADPRHRAPARDPLAIGRELGVDVIVDGNVRRLADRVRVTLRLLSVTDGVQLGTHRFEGAFGDLLTIAADAKSAITTAVAVDAAPAKPSGTTDPITLELYFRARHAHDLLTRDGADRACALLSQALARAPDDPRVLAAYATALTRRMLFGGRTDLYGEALVAAECAVSLGPDSSEAHFALASLRMHAVQIEAAARDARRATELAPSDARARALVGRLLVESGRTAEGMELLRLALTIERGLDLARAELMRAHALLGEWDHARSFVFAAADTERSWPFWVYGLRLFATWQVDHEAIAEIRRSVGRSSYASEVLSSFMAYVDIAERGDATQRLARIRSFFLEEGNTPSNRCLGHQLAAEVLGHTGRNAEAFEEVAQAASIGLTDLLWIDRCPALDQLRADVRFPAVREEIAARAERVVRVLL